MNRLLMLLLAIVGIADRSSAQSPLLVYPGDVTNNGVVNTLDFLHLGLAYNFSGPARDSSGLDFSPKPAQPWSLQFPGGLNMAYADCNGDGNVNYFFDAFPLYTHYGQQRSNNVVPDEFPPGLPGIDAPLRFDHSAVPGLVHGGQVVRIPVELGSEAIPAEDFYGIAFSIQTDPSAINLDQSTTSFAESSWANPDNDRIWMSKKAATNRIDVGFVRTDRNQKSGFGRIGYVDYVIIVDVIGFQTIPVILNQVKMMDKFGNYTTIAGDTIWLQVAPPILSSTENVPDMPKVDLFPNPAQDYLTIQSSALVRRLRMTDLLGRTVLEEQPSAAFIVDLHWSSLPAGLYLLQIETDQGMALRRVQIQR